MVERGRVRVEATNTNCNKALVNYNGEALSSAACSKLWIEQFLAVSGSSSCPTYPKRIGYGLLRAQVNNNKT